MIRHWGLGLAVLLFGGCSLFHSPPFRDIGVHDAQVLIKENPKLYILDIRSEAETKRGYIPGAHLISVKEVLEHPEALPADKSLPLLVYATAGVQSAKLCRVLYKKGYTQLYNLAGGYLVWRTSNMPIEKPR